ncbi:MAG: S8 family serine peptidase [Clostridia bacterium]|nr:S8 family serine peptidase [Clostridia bacterium]
MKKTISKLIAALLAAAMVFSLLGFAARLAPAKAAVETPENTESGRDPHEIVTIMVKLKDAPVLEKVKLDDARSSEMTAALKAKQDKLISQIESKLNGKARLDIAYQYTLIFNGFSFKGEYRLINEIKKLAGVANCYESWSYELPEEVEPDQDPTRLSTSVGWINADDMWSLGYTGQGQTIAVIDTGILKTHNNFSTAPVNPHFNAANLQTILDNYDLCAEQRYTGGTLTGSALYYSAKIPYTYNYFRGNLDVSHNDAGSDHGTHVSSICAGNDNSARGVAYNAQILSMQVFQDGGAEFADILAALEDCAYLHVDALNMSLGADCGFTHDEDLNPTFRLLSENGVNCAVASGNSGYAGSGNNFSGAVPTFNIDDGVTSTPASMPEALCVAASSDSSAATPTSYSSWGTTSDLRIKPEIMAPGDNINAAIGTGSYGTKSGTSMATPHIAGGMVLVNQYVNTAFPDLSEEAKMQMVNTLLMCTAVPSKSGSVPYSVRWQGAGQADLTAAIGTQAYIEVANSVRPKLELGDDDERTGVFDLTFDIVNFSGAALTYTVNPYVLMDNASSRTIGGRQAYVLSHNMLNITNQVTVTKPNTVTVPANGRTTVTVTVDVNPMAASINQKFPLGAYIEGYIMLDGGVDLSVPFLGFYGDWEEAAVFDREYYYDTYLHTNEWPAAWGTNTASANGSLLGVNPFGATTNFLLDRASISPNGDGWMDAIDDVRTYLLRNVENFRYEVVDADSGEQYFVQDVPFCIKGVENGWLSSVEPVGGEDWSKMDAWGGEGLASGTHCILRMTGDMQSVDEFDPAANQNAVWEIPVTVDYDDPEVIYWNMHNGELNIYVSDNHYVAFVGVYSNAACTSLISSELVEENQRGTMSMLTFDVGNRQTVYVKVGDYAYNFITATITEGEGGSLDPVDLEGISLDPAQLTVYEGFSGELNLIRNPSNANNYEITWTSANESIATVRGAMAKGIVTGVTEGTTTVTATATDKNTGEVFTATATIVVNDYPTISEALNVSGGNINFTSNGAYPWVVEFLDNRVVAKSTNQGVVSSSSTVTAETMTLEAGDKISFKWMVSSESNYDKLKFFVNNSEITNISGTAGGWTTYEYTVTSNGSYTFKWEYNKDYSVNSGDDTGWLDDVEMTYVNPPEPQFLRGDCDQNGIVDISDALLALRHAMGLITLEGNGLLAGEIDGDGVITISDALLIMRYSMGLIDEL